MTAEDALDAFIDSAGRVLALSIALDWKPAVRQHLAVILAQAALVSEFPLADEAEPAPVYEL